MDKEIKSKSQEVKEELNSTIDKELNQEKLGEQELGDAWEQFVKKVGLGDIIHDLMTRIVDDFKNDFKERNPNEIIDFGIKLKRVKNASHMFAKVELTLELYRNGSAVVISRKVIEFKHIKEARMGHMWKAQLYEALLKHVMYFGLTYIMIQDDIRLGKIKQPTT